MAFSPWVPIWREIRRIPFYPWAEGHDEVHGSFGERCVEDGVVVRWRAVDLAERIEMQSGGDV